MGVEGARRAPVVLEEEEELEDAPRRVDGDEHVAAAAQRLLHQLEQLALALPSAVERDERGARRRDEERRPVEGLERAGGEVALLLVVARRRVHHLLRLLRDPPQRAAERVPRRVRRDRDAGALPRQLDALRVLELVEALERVLDVDQREGRRRYCAAFCSRTARSAPSCAPASRTPAPRRAGDPCGSPPTWPRSACETSTASIRSTTARSGSSCASSSRSVTAVEQEDEVVDLKEVRRRRRRVGAARARRRVKEMEMPPSRKSPAHGVRGAGGVFSTRSSRASGMIALGAASATDACAWRPSPLALIAEQSLVALSRRNLQGTRLRR